MEQNLIEKRLRKQALEEAKKEFFNIKREVSEHPILGEIYKYVGQEKICGTEYVSLLTGMTVENIEQAINKRAEVIYRGKVDNLLAKMDSLQYFFDQM